MDYRWLLLVGVAACGTPVKGNARVVKGATTGTSARTQNLVRPGADGHYFLSPNASTIEIVSIGFKGDSNSEFTLSDCKPSYQRDAAELTSFLDCPFEVDAGTYTAMDIGLATSAQVTVDDATNGLFTDSASPTGLSAVAPAGGAASVKVTVNSPNSDRIMSQSAFVEPVVVEEGKPVTVTLLEDMIHTMSGDVAGGQPRFDLSLPLAPVFMVATAGEVTQGSVEYYAPSGTAANSYQGTMGSGNEAYSARVFFVNGKPSFVWHVTLGNSEAWASDPRGGDGSRAGGYLGLDGNGMLCWAQTNSDSLSWDESGYSRICRMKHLTNLGETTTIECKTQNTAPAPTAGHTYESGCPDFTPNESQMVTLVAK